MLLMGKRAHVITGLLLNDAVSDALRVERAGAFAQRAQVGPCPLVHAVEYILKISLSFETKEGRPSRYLAHQCSLRVAVCLCSVRSAQWPAEGSAGSDGHHAHPGVGAGGRGAVLPANCVAVVLRLSGSHRPDQPPVQQLGRPRRAACTSSGACPLADATASACS